ncbi:MAG TPA: carbohydrate binding domain-containing protein [Actinomycetota bacterium]|nr:carbohydrate binding domain-containing protein [Actinomycetota bacterium]
MRSLRRPRRLALPIGLLWVAMLAVPTAAALPSTSTPVLTLDRTIRTTPFAGSTISARDAEGLAYVPRDRSLWLVGDNGASAYEFDALGGALKRVVGVSAFTAATQLGGTAPAGTDRVGDLESLAYDEANDTLYAFSGSCCSSSALPTVFRFTRDGAGHLSVDSYQALPTGSDFTGAAWNPVDGQLYVGKGTAIRRYDYASNAVGGAIGVGVTGILGMDVTSAGDLVVVTTAERLYRIDWGSKRVVAGWNLDLTGFGIRDSRAVEVIPDPSSPSADQLSVADGYDGRSSGDPLRYAISVFDVTDGGGAGGGGSGTGEELVANPGFETDTAGWTGSGVATLGRSTLARTGSGSALLSNVTEAAGSCVLNDRPNSVSSTTTGTYTASLWVRSDRPGTTIRLRLREFASGSLVRISTTSAALGTAWQRIVVSIDAQAGHSLDLAAVVPRAAVGECFEADDASLRLS